MEKKEIRAFVYEQRRRQTALELQKNSQIICARITHTEAFQKTPCIYAYMAAKGEVGLAELLKVAWQRGKRVAVPKVVGNELEFFYISSYQEVQPGYFGILEPTTTALANEEDALMIVPGVAFDRKGHRCGYGKGFYDRYLKRHTKHKTLSPAFDFQIMEDVPVEEHDRLLQAVFTETQEWYIGDGLSDETC